MHAKTFASLCALGFVQMAGYAIARPATESFFLEQCGAAALPWVWLAVALTALAVTTIYNRFSANVDLGRLFAACAYLACGVLVTLLVLTKLHPRSAAFALYVWKDVYIVVLVEVFWTFANAIYELATARWIYGVFLASGGAGGLLGNFGVGPLAQTMGTEATLWLVVPACIVTGTFAYFAMHGVVRPDGSVKVSYSDGFARVARSRYLLLIVALVALIQLVVTLVDYQFNVAVLAAYPGVDARTAIVGKVYGVISIFEVTLQLASGFVLRYLGVTATLIGVPLLLGATIAAAVVQPVFLTTAVAKVTSKALDYSLMRSAKELLYIPLPYADKAQGKAVVDVLTYRTAKGGVSLLLMGLAAVNIGTTVPLTAALLVAWLAVSISLAKQFRALNRLP